MLIFDCYAKYQVALKGLLRPVPYSYLRLIPLLISQACPLLISQAYPFTHISGLSLTHISGLSLYSYLRPVPYSYLRLIPLLISQACPLLISQACPLLISQAYPLLISQACPLTHISGLFPYSYLRLIPLLISQACPLLISQAYSFKSYLCSVTSHASGMSLSHIPRSACPHSNISPCGCFILQDDPNLFDNNVQDRVNAFVAAATDQAKHYTTNNIMMTFGDDFQFEGAHMNFKNIDKLIKYVNEVDFEQVTSSVCVHHSPLTCYHPHLLHSSS